MLAIDLQTLQNRGKIKKMKKKSNFYKIKTDEEIEQERKYKESQKNVFNPWEDWEDTNKWDFGEHTPAPTKNYKYNKNMNNVRSWGNRNRSTYYFPPVLKREPIDVVDGWSDKDESMEIDKSVYEYASENGLIIVSTKN